MTSSPRLPAATAAHRPVTMVTSAAMTAGTTQTLKKEGESKGGTSWQQGSADQKTKISGNP